MTDAENSPAPPGKRKRRDDSSGESTESTATSISIQSTGSLYKQRPSEVDRTFPQPRRTFPVLNDHAIVLQWSTGLREKALAEIRRLDNWRAVEVLRRGFVERASEAPPQILITVDKGTLTVPNQKQAWLELADTLRGLLVEENLADVGVEVTEGEIWRLVRSKQPYSLYPAPGASISLAKSTSSGSLGGYLEISRKSMESKTVGLTCHHVLSETDCTTTQSLAISALYPWLTQLSIFLKWYSRVVSQFGIEGVPTE